MHSGRTAHLALISFHLFAHIVLLSSAPSARVCVCVCAQLSQAASCLASVAQVQTSIKINQKHVFNLCAVRATLFALDTNPRESNLCTLSLPVFAFGLELGAEMRVRTRTRMERRRNKMARTRSLTFGGARNLQAHACSTVGPQRRNHTSQRELFSATSSANSWQVI